MILCIQVQVTYHCTVGEERMSTDLLTSLIGMDATYTNTITNPMMCEDIANPDDELKEGVILRLLRIDSLDSAVCLGRDQALVIETGTGGNN